MGEEGINAKKTLSLLVFFCMLSPSLYSYLPSGFVLSPFASGDASSLVSEPSGTPLPPGSVSSKSTLNVEPNLVSRESVIVPFYIINSTGIFWGNNASSSNAFGLKVATANIASVSSYCATTQSLVSFIHNSTTYVYSMSGAYSGNCGNFAGQVSTSWKMYVDNVSGRSYYKEIYVSGSLAMSGSGTSAAMISFPLILPASYNVGTDNINSTDNSVSFFWGNITEDASLQWNGATKSLQVVTPTVNGSSVINFAYDPTTITTTSFTLLADNSAHYIFQNNGYYWAFWAVSDNLINYSSSPNGVTWSSSSSVISGCSYQNWHLFSVAVKPSSDNGAVVCTFSGNPEGFEFAELTFGDNGVLTAGTVHSVDVSAITLGALDIVWSTKSSRWDVAGSVLSINSPPGAWEAWNSNMDGSGTWSTYGLSGCSDIYQVIVTSSDGIFCEGSGTSNNLYYAGTLGTAVSSTGITTDINGRGWSALALSNGTNILVHSATSSPYTLYYSTSSNSFTTSTSLSVASVYSGGFSPTGAMVTLSTDGSNVYVFYAPSTTSISYEKVSTTISSPTVITTGESTLQALSAERDLNPSYLLALLYFTGSSSPFNVRFVSLPTVIPDAATSSNSWSKPGLSPYENYFTGESEYVSPGNGLLGIEQTDYSLAGRDLSLSISRVYSTPYAFGSSAPYLYDNYTLSNLGLGWQLNFPWMGQTYLHLSDGQVYQYNWTGGTFLNVGGTPFRLVNNSGSSYDLYLASGVDYHFNSAKQLSSISDPTGNNTISFTYGSNNYISEITDTADRNITFSYNGSNQLATIVTGEGDFTYGYSGNNLASVTDPAGRVTDYHYSTGINSWLISSVDYPTGAYTNYSYGNATVGSGVTTYYVTSQNIYVSSNVLSKSTAYSYHITNGLVQYCNSSISNGQAKQGYIDYVFNTPGKSTEVEKNSTNSTILSYESDYDSLGRINESKILSPTGSVLAYSSTLYDNWSNVIYTKNYNGRQTWYSYANTNTTNAYEDGASGFTSSFYTNNTMSSNIHDLLVGEAYWQNTVGSSNNIETYYNYNSAGDLLHQKQLNASGWQVSSYTYDNYGNQITSTDPLGRTTYNQYSSTYNHAYLTQSSILVGGQNVSTTKTYNLDTGTLNSVTDPNGQTTYYSYDSIGRLQSISYPTVNHVNAYTYYTYNDVGNYVTITDPNGDNVTNYYDGLDRLTSVATYNGSSVYSTQNYTYNYLNLVASNTTATGNEYKYTYDSLGFLTSVINPDSTALNYTYNYQNNTETVTDENGHETQYAYDWMHNLIWVKQWNSSTSYYQTNYSYDLFGNLLSTQDPLGHITTYNYDDLNRLILTKYPDGTNTTSTYDSVGNLISQTDPMGQKATYSYDALNRLTNITLPDHSTVSYTYDNDGNRIKMVDSFGASYYTYDARGRLTNETDVINGTAYRTLYTYDKASNILSISYPNDYNLTYSYDALERVSRVGSIANFTYTKDNQIATISYANGIKTTYGYDSRDMPTQILSKDGSTKVMDLNYTYDAVGNVISLTSQNYTYDALNRLTNSSGPGSAVSYTYDGAGNIVKTVEGSTQTTNTYDSYDRLLSSGNINFTYNANGDMIKVENGSNNYQYTYDSVDRLTSVIKNGNTLMNNTWNSDGKLVTEKIGSSSTNFVYEGSQIIYQYNTTSSSSTDSVYANGLQIAQVSGSAVTYLLSDALGSIRYQTTSLAQVSFSTDYLAYGSIYGASGTLEQFLFNDKLDIIDAGGIYLYGARFYDPAIERFLTEDTSTGSSSDPQSLNRYIYARDNPISITDINGHGWWSSLTHAVSDVAAAVNTVAETETSLPSDVSKAWNSLPPSEQADVVTIGVDALAAGAVAADVLTVGSLTPLTQAAVGAAISTTAYTLQEGSNANFAGAAGAAVSGAIIGGITGGLGGVAASSISYGVKAGLATAGSAGADVLGADVSGAISGSKPDINPSQIVISSALSGLTMGVGPRIVEEAGLSSVGRPATRASTLLSGLLNPYDSPRAAYQVYSGIAQFGVGFGSEMASGYVSRMDWFTR